MSRYKFLFSFESFHRKVYNKSKKRYKEDKMKTTFKMLKLGSLLVGALCLSSVTLNAQEMPQRGPMSFEMYDANGDGAITQEEFDGLHQKRMEQKQAQGMPMRNVGNAPNFHSFDKDKDGKLTEMELLKGQNKHMQENRANKGYGKGMK